MIPPSENITLGNPELQRELDAAPLASGLQGIQLPPATTQIFSAPQLELTFGGVNGQPTTNIENQINQALANGMEVHEVVVEPPKATSPHSPCLGEHAENCVCISKVYDDILTYATYVMTHPGNRNVIPPFDFDPPVTMDASDFVPFFSLECIVHELCNSVMKKLVLKKLVEQETAQAAKANTVPASL